MREIVAPIWVRKGSLVRDLEAFRQIGIRLLEIGCGEQPPCIPEYLKADGS